MATVWLLCPLRCESYGGLKKDVLYVLVQSFFVTLVIPSIESVRVDGVFIHTLGDFPFSENFRPVVHSIISNVVYISAIVRFIRYSLSPAKLSQDSKGCTRENSRNTLERKHNLSAAFHDDFFGDKTVKHPLKILFSQFGGYLISSSPCSPIVHICPIQQVIQILEGIHVVKSMQLPSPSTLC